MTSQHASQYEVDIQVKTSLFGNTLCQCRIHGQRLVLSNDQKVLCVLDVAQCALKVHNSSKYLYRLEMNGQTKATLYLPSSTFRRKFEQVMQLAAGSPHWELPVATEQEELLAIASCITETEKTRKNSSGIISPVEVQHVQEYLRKLMVFHDELKDLCTEQVYYKLLHYEALYAQNPELISIAQTVHKLNPVDYAQFRGEVAFGHFVKTKYGNGGPLRDIFNACPHCHHPWWSNESYLIHIEGEEITCPGCSALVNYDMYKIAALILEHSPFICNTETWGGETIHIEIPSPPIPRDGRVKSFVTQLSQATQKANIGRSSIIYSHVKSGIRSKLELYLNREVGRFHVDIVRGLFCLWQFTRELAPHFDYWMQPVVIDASITRFHKLMAVVKKNVMTHRVVPTADIELIWQTFQDMDPKAYLQYHETVYGEHILCYNDEALLWNTETCYADTFLRWFQQYNEPYSSHPASFDAWTYRQDKSLSKLKLSTMRMTWDKLYRLPARNSGFFPVDYLHLPVAETAPQLEEEQPEVEQPVINETPVLIRDGYVIGSLVPNCIFAQHSTQIRQLIEEDGNLCERRFAIKKDPYTIHI